jgi:NAD(P)-dependent dehydrogenase (short-subunit alcohol dehydrogenase family)
MAYENSSWVARVAVVIGGTTGIGRSLALDLTAAGAGVVATVAFWPAE